jgi:hypothetical protein
VPSLHSQVTVLLSSGGTDSIILSSPRRQSPCIQSQHYLVQVEGLDQIQRREEDQGLSSRAIRYQISVHGQGKVRGQIQTQVE